MRGPVNAKWGTREGGGPCQIWPGPQSVAGHRLLLLGDLAQAFPPGMPTFLPFSAHFPRASGG